jgi:hypothetical protein
MKYLEVTEVTSLRDYAADRRFISIIINFECAGQRDIVYCEIFCETCSSCV